MSVAPHAKLNSNPRADREENTEPLRTSGEESTKDSAVDPDADPFTDAFSEDDLREFLNNGWFVALNPQEVVFGWGEWSYSQDCPRSESDCSLYAPDFFLESSAPWRFTPSWAILSRSRFASLVLAGVQKSVNSEQQGFRWVEPPQADFQRQFDAIREGFKSRGLKKAVPIVFARAEMSMTEESRGSRLLGMIMQAFSQPQHLFPYGFWSTREGLLGVTPEILFTQTEDKIFQTVALAGTRAKSEGAAQDLLNDPKERHEHQLVIDDLREVLGQTGKVEVSETTTMELPTLFHLRTEIKAQPSQNLSFEEKVRLLHPTPALGLAPRKLGFEEMRRWDDGRTRSRYGAPFGISLERFDGSHVEHALVGIRNVQWRDDQFILGSGCGIVPESDPEREWRELELKRNSVKRMLGV